MNRDKIEIKKSLIPYNFNISLAGEIFNLRVDYNATGDFFTVQASKNGDLICAGEPIVYGVPLFQDLYLANVFPALEIVPIDESAETDKVTFDNLGKTVYLLIDNGIGDINGE